MIDTYNHIAVIHHNRNRKGIFTDVRKLQFFDRKRKHGSKHKKGRAASCSPETDNRLLFLFGKPCVELSLILIDHILQACVIHLLNHLGDLAVDIIGQSS